MQRKGQSCADRQKREQPTKTFTASGELFAHPRPNPRNWVCEIISPSTAGYDRVKKMAKYAKFGVGYAWLIDPVVKTLEAYKLESGHWLLLDAYVGAEKVRMEPFQEMEIDLEVLWLEP
ncbi:MAG: Uma2 family endonuclease [Syntrophobacteraceae bacterium]